MAFKTSKLWASDGFHSPNHWKTKKNSQCFNIFIAKLAETSHLLPRGVGVLLGSLGGVAVAGPEGLAQSSREVVERWRASVPGREVLWIITSTLTDARVPSLLRNQHKAAADREGSGV